MKPKRLMRAFWESCASSNSRKLLLGGSMLYLATVGAAAVNIAPAGLGIMGVNNEIDG